MAKTSTTRRKRLQAARASSLPESEPMPSVASLRKMFIATLDDHIQMRANAMLAQIYQRHCQSVADVLQAINEGLKKNIANMRDERIQQEEGRK
ncbi:hypothetical protein [Comamonas odontotermitis]|uniref:hypothetical protein n=1 Tax=Comamonas odontotermitis TaxID=379895 RepID=UPI001CC7D414|nr:hypothetical protein [Comamonas odontotermitis]UBB19526.1 hypothetical protein LAD35_22235 [Comamonas odontotermitis]